MARSTWKGPFIDHHLLKKIEAALTSNKKEMINTRSRRSTIFPEAVGMTIGVYNGNKVIPVLVTDDMVGHKFGEFALTRTYTGHGVDKKATKK